MRIKLWESFSNYYQEIDSIEYENLYSNKPFDIRENKLYFSNYEINYLKDLRIEVWRGDEGVIKGNIERVWECRFSDSNYYNSICKLDDEWFLFYSMFHNGQLINRYWKCDQWDGLLKLLKSRRII